MSSLHLSLSLIDTECSLLGICVSKQPKQVTTMPERNAVIAADFYGVLVFKLQNLTRSLKINTPVNAEIE